MADGPLLKGLAFHSVMGVLAELKGAEFRRQIEERLDGELGQAWAHGELLPSGFYPMAWYRELFRVIQRLDPDPELVPRIGRASIEADLNRFHRLIMKRLSPKTLMMVATRLFDRYFERGSLEVVESSPGRLRVRWQGCEGFDDAMWIEHMAGAEHLVRLSGAEDISFRVIAGGRGESTTAEVVTTWR